LGSACAADPMTDPSPDPLEEMTDLGCSSIFLQDQLQEYRVTISPAELTALDDEFLNRADREAMGLDPHPYHPIELTANGIPIYDAMIRLKGQSSWWQAIEFDANPKMQFVISFNELDPDGRYQGTRKVELDMTRTDGSFLRQRLGLYFLRRAGIPAQCANSARLTINGEYYGLYTHLERLDKEFLQRLYGDDDEADLWKGGRYIETNEDTVDPARINVLWEATTAAQVEQLVDVEASIAEWAAEAVLPQGDGYYNGRANFFLYDHPDRGFIWLPHDLDSGIDFLAASESPMFPACDGRHPNDRQHWALILGEPRWQDLFVEEMARARGFYDVGVFESITARFAAQIHDAAAEDPMKPFTTFDHELAIERLGEYYRARAAVVDDWLSCRQNGGTDADGDGFESCFECDDTDPAVNPAAVDTCNDIDDNCDGIVDGDVETWAC
jgi:hypothetical protein